ncbi:DUF1236 domain-containing protein [Mangrovibrevibacter kandeliae]|uniref:DUF1236 domain-containing protein n=1 Tax=Mangrovibrevibacter kandeliae TaxID=2968473 RepID=UPI0021183B95|nr:MULTISPECIES: DUF1236 domain-containing protein [unclassified Aurantimonas]MCQ8783740.1 DUF1236 domain-containing protein [Aurantimonas sp. CSK15Z-1]MCW4116297.1 DUF1236 domain-containing protein [Aurantimonas sp. MSK8Z-1]
MRKILLASAALALLAGPAAAQNKQSQGVAAGTATGAVGGAIVGGPVGAIVGGVIGAAVGSAAAAPEPVRQYVIDNPTEPVSVEGKITEGYIVPQSVTLTEVPDDPDYAYFYANGGRPVIVKASDRTIVYAPASTPEPMIKYVRSNPVQTVTIDGPVEVGTQVPATVTLQPIPDYKGYSYFYYNGRPYVVDDANRQVVYYVN